MRESGLRWLLVGALAGHARHCVPSARPGKYAGKPPSPSCEDRPYRCPRTFARGDRHRPGRAPCLPWSEYQASRKKMRAAPIGNASGWFGSAPAISTISRDYSSLKFCGVDHRGSAPSSAATASGATVRISAAGTCRSPNQDSRAGARYGRRPGPRRRQQAAPALRPARHRYSQCGNLVA